MASKLIGGISVSISANTSPFTAGLTKGRKALGSFVSGVKGAIFSVKGLGVALGAAGAAAGLGVMTKRAFTAVDAMGELSDKLGVSTEHIKGLQMVAEEAGISSQTLEKAMVTLNKNGMGGIDGLKDWITQTSKLTTHQQRLAAATEMFGSRGSDMVRMLAGGVVQFDEAQKRSEAFGWNLSRGAVAGVERAMDAFGRLKEAIGGIFANTAAELGPILGVLTNKLTDFATANGRAAGAGKWFGQAIVSGIGLMADGIQQLVAAGMKFYADATGMFHSMRGSFVGRRMGMGFASQDEEQQSSANVLQRQFNADIFAAKTPWSMGIDAAAKEAADEFAKQLAVENWKALARQATSVAGAAIGGARNWAGMAGGAAAGAGSAIGGMKFAPAKAAAAGMSSPQQSLAFTQSGSADSYRQQAAIRRQADAIPKKQLNKLEKIEHHLASMNRNAIFLEPANLS